MRIGARAGKTWAAGLGSRSVKVLPRTLGLLAIALALGGAARAEDSELDAGLERLLRSAALRGARVGVVVEELESGRRLLAHAPDSALVPASNQKLLIASAALAHWGPAHRFETPVLVSGEIVDGVIEGPLWIVGQGDPSLVSESLWKLAEEVRLRGVREIRGGIAIDASRFEGPYFHPDWQPVSSRAYYAPTSAWSANYSSFRIDVGPGARVGEPAQVRLAPALPYFRTLADAPTLRGGGKLGLEVDVLPDGTGESVRVTGSVSADREPETFWRAVGLPERYAAALLRAQLEAQGVSVGPQLRFEPVPADARELLRFAGEPIALQVRLLSKYSNNFVAEQLTKSLGADRFGAPGSWEKGVRALAEHVASVGAASPGNVIADGSGLSPRNRVSSATLAALIRASARSFSYGPEFLAALPLGGRDGTLQTRMRDLDATVRAKTGHLQRVASLAGVVPNSAGQPLIFVLIVNGARGSSLDVDAAIDAFVAELGAAQPAVASLPAGALR
jgi:D-alanyl-D-alanine carboxypeptidase/D-alanyl-D-alanine-endopeptidase (penicillin-binding protein 4)